MLHSCIAAFGTSAPILCFWNHSTLSLLGSPLTQPIYYCPLVRDPAHSCINIVLISNVIGILSWKDLASSFRTLCICMEAGQTHLWLETKNNLGMMPVDVSQFPNELFITSIPTISVVAFFQDCAIPPCMYKSFKQMRKMRGAKLLYRDARKCGLQVVWNLVKKLRFVYLVQVRECTFSTSFSHNLGPTC